MVYRHLNFLLFCSPCCSKPELLYFVGHQWRRFENVSVCLYFCPCVESQWGPVLFWFPKTLILQDFNIYFNRCFFTLPLRNFKQSIQYWASNDPFKHLQQNQSTGSFSLKLTKEYTVINNYELQNYNRLFEKRKKKLADDNWLANYVPDANLRLFLNIKSKYFLFDQPVRIHLMEKP